MSLNHILFIIISVLALNQSAWAESITGKVVAVTDGDTIRLLDAGKVQYKIRLTGIDAPESRQAFGEVSKRNLSDLIFGREIVADCPKRDRYNRSLCKLILDGKDINLEQIKSGLAWHYKAYASDQPVADRVFYSEAEQRARESRVGLWSEENAMPPWEWRKQRRAKSKAKKKSKEPQQK